MTLPRGRSYRDEAHKVQVVIVVDDIDTAIADWTHIEVHKAASKGGTYSLETTLTLAAETSVYTYEDADATDGLWYKWRFKDATPNYSDFSEVWRAIGRLSWLELRRRVAARLGPVAYRYGQATQAGTTSTLIDEVRFLDLSVDRDLWKNAWELFVNDADGVLNEGDIRHIAEYDPTTGTLTVTPPHGGATAADDEFEVHRRLRPDDLLDRANVAIRACRYLDTCLLYIPSSAKLIELPGWIERPEDIIEVYALSGTNTDKRKRIPIPVDWFKPRNFLGRVALDVRTGSTALNKVIVEAYRRPPEISADTDTVDGPEDLLEEAIVCEALEWLTKMPGREEKGDETEFNKAKWRVQALREFYAPLKDARQMPDYYFLGPEDWPS